jgi:hypothetical protein
LAGGTTLRGSGLIAGCGSAAIVHLTFILLTITGKWLMYPPRNIRRSCQTRSNTPTSVGESPPWTRVVLNAAETSRNLHEFVKGNPLYSALHGVYAEVLQDLKDVLKENTDKGQTATQDKEPDGNEEFREQQRRKRNPSDEVAKKPKTSMPTAGIKDSRLRSQQGVSTRNFFAPLRATEMEWESNKIEASQFTSD